MGLLLASLSIVDPHETHSFFSVLPPITMVSRFTELESWYGKYNSPGIDSFDI